MIKSVYKTGFCGQETTTRRCPYAQVWLYMRFVN